MYPEKAIIQKDTCTPMFITTLFTIARTWKQLKCPSTEEWIKIYVVIHTIQYNGILLRHKSNEILPSAETWMDLETAI